MNKETFEDFMMAQSLNTPDDYHNLSIDLIRANHEDAAFYVVWRGLSVFPCNDDLLADSVQYAPMTPALEFDSIADGPDIIKHELFGDIPDTYIKSIPEDEWYNVTVAELCYRLLMQTGLKGAWRQYEFSIDYLIDRKLSTLSIKLEQDNVRNCLIEAYDLAQRFVESCKNNEHSYKALAKVLKSIEQCDMWYIADDGMTYESVLHNVVHSGIPAAQCCVSYMDLLLETGRYKEAEQVAYLGLKYTSQTRPSARIPYFLYGLTLAKDYQLIDRVSADGNRMHKINNSIYSEAELNNEAVRIIEMYRQICEIDDKFISSSYKDTARLRICVLSVLFNLK